MRRSCSSETANTVYTSFDGGRHWRPLGLNLPHVEVRDLAINAREGELVAATHGRSFWILDDLALLEQLSRDARPAVDSAYLYAPQAAWLTSAYGQSDDAKYLGPIGLNPPFGATVFFHIPANYDGKMPVQLPVPRRSGPCGAGKSTSSEKEDTQSSRR